MGGGNLHSFEADIKLHAWIFCMFPMIPSFNSILISWWLPYFFIADVFDLREVTRGFNAC